ncbi:hypothetical protein EK904_007249 [Melospiza melodia maxima]|nr:hypothetical protein EK904_007249 [Melospiza melodia maxima]
MKQSEQDWVSIPHGRSDHAQSTPCWNEGSTLCNMCCIIFVIKHDPEIPRKILYERARDCLKSGRHLSMLSVDCFLG